MSNDLIKPAVPDDAAVRAADKERARDLAARYMYEFVDLGRSDIDVDLFRATPVELMFRYKFVPLGVERDALVVAMADPSNLVAVDEVSSLLGRRLLVRVAAEFEISDLLKKSESSQRVLDEATEDFRLDIIREDESGEETITIEKIELNPEIL